MSCCDKVDESGFGLEPGVGVALLAVVVLVVLIVVAELLAFLFKPPLVT